METIENIDFNELRISSEEMKYYDAMEIYGCLKGNIVKRREFSLEYKGGKPKFRADGRLCHLIYPGIYSKEEEDSISSFWVKLKERLDFIFKGLMEEYAKVNKTIYGTGISFGCKVDGIDREWVYDWGIPFTGSCEFEIVRVACRIGGKYANLFEVHLIAKDVKVRKLADVESKYEMV